MVHNPGPKRNERKNKGAKKGVNEAMRQLITNFPGHIIAIQEYDEGYLHEEDEERFHIIAPKNDDYKYGLAVMARKYNQ